MNISETRESLIIDCQLFQTFSRQRGMGKYSLELLKTMLSDPVMQQCAIYLLFSSKAPKNQEMLDQLKRLMPEAGLLHLDLLPPREPREEHSVQAIRQINKATLSNYVEQHFTESSKPKFLILSLYLDEVCSVFPDNLIISDKIILYYDSIPYLYHERYGRFKNFFDHYYLPHTASLFEATKILTISKTVANDLHLYFGIPTERIFNIDGAPIPRNTNKPKMPKGWRYKKDEFVLMPTGQEIRKNNLRATQAFENFSNQTGTNYKLIITSHFSQEGREELKKLSDRIDFSGNVEEPELLWLYQNCRFVLFPSEYEGLGLPVLEAVEQEKVVACSRIPVFKEMSPDAFYFFDPMDIDDMTAVLHEANAAVHSGINDHAYQQVLQKYNWKRTAQLATEALDSDITLPVAQKKKIAIFSPDPSGFSAIGKDTGEMHAWYSQFFDIDYYFDKGPNHKQLRPNILKYATNCYEASSFTKADYDRYDAVIYHVGNSEYHLNIIRAALVYRGYVILHDTNLEGLYNNLLELGYITEQRYQAEINLEKLLSHKKSASHSSLITSVINNQKTVFVHSTYACEAVRAKILGPIPVVYLELPFDTPIFTDILPHEERYVTIAFAGIIAQIKGIDIMEGIALSEDFADCQINIFGFSSTDTAQLKKLRQLPNVRITTNTSDFEFQQLLMSSDIMVNVRLAYRGETSGSTLSHMRYGGIALVRDFGWFSELPNDVVVKVDGPEKTIPALASLVKDKSKQSQLHAKALDYMRNHHSHEAYAKGLWNTISKS